jgi:hypothetical protein
MGRSTWANTGVGARIAVRKKAVRIERRPMKFTTEDAEGTEVHRGFINWDAPL